MSRQFIFDTLSKQLQAQDISHTKVAEHLQLTVTATKLIFDTQDCTLSCIDQPPAQAGSIAGTFDPAT